MLVADDDPDILELVRYNLSREGYVVHTARDGAEAWEILNDETIDLALLDIGMPGSSGVDLCERMKKSERLKSVPLIFVTARTMESDVILGFRVGADDYIRKPFSAKELVVRVNSLLKRTYGSEDAFRYLQLELNFDRHQCRINGERVNLTPHEFGLLKLLVRAEGRTISRSILLEKVWGMESHSSPRSVDIVVTRLREKVKPYNHLIRTVAGVGYQWDVESEMRA